MVNKICTKVTDKGKKSRLEEAGNAEGLKRQEGKNGIWNVQRGDEARWGPNGRPKNRSQHERLL